MHQFRAVSLHSYLDVAAFVGIDGPRLLKSAGFAPSDLEDPEARLPAVAAIGILERSARLSGYDSFGIRMAECRSFASLGPVSLLLERLSTVGELLEVLQKAHRLFNDVLFISSDRSEHVVSAKFDLVSPFDRPQASDLTIGLGYIALAGASHGRWSPEAVHFTHKAPNDRATFERFFRAPLEFNSDFNGFSFGASALNTTLPLADAAMAANARRLLETIKMPALRAPVSDHARHSIALLLPAGRATVGDVARNLNRTSRVLQRQLREEGCTFAALLNQVRRDLAVRYLSGSPQSMTSISENLGYGNVGSFTRWFDGEFSMPPSAWRKAQRQPSGQPPPMWKV